jgi:Recombination protein O N terminal
VFKTEAVVLHTLKIRDHKTRIVLLTREYGRISCWDSSIKNNYSSWDLLSVCIERVSGTNRIKSRDILYTVPFPSWSYDQVYGFLEMLLLMYELLPEALVTRKIYDDYSSLMQSAHLAHIQIHHSILLKLRILKHLGYLGETSFTLPILSYIYTYHLHTNQQTHARKTHDTRNTRSTRKDHTFHTPSRWRIQIKIQ